eukprot:07285.XXX_257522_257701_1 [CDS] Oithona nana genome sequencing.
MSHGLGVQSAFLAHSNLSSNSSISLLVEGTEFLMSVSTRHSIRECKWFSAHQNSALLSL